MSQGTCGWASLAVVDNVFGVAQRGRDLYFQLLLGAPAPLAPAPLILLLLRCRPSFRRAGVPYRGSGLYCRLPLAQSKEADPILDVEDLCSKEHDSWHSTAFSRKTPFRNMSV